MKASPQAPWASVPLLSVWATSEYFSSLSQSCSTKGPSLWHVLDNNLGYYY